MAKTDGPTPGYRPCVGLMLIGPDGRVFVGRRDDITAAAWQMPQGGIGKGEAPRAAALRELAEEIGTDKAEVIAESGRWLDYDLPDHLQGKVWKGRWRGQSLKWFALRFVGTDMDIRLDTDHQEFLDWRWVALDELSGLIVDFKRPVYDAVVEEFRPVVEAIAAKAGAESS
ncbi:MAG: RNA pyrophosphohydrolase [Alphaproteobacteria bacterium]|nr:RNA pyrophosphohydrolase [Alphaproteobacteria bacterium]